MDCLDRRRSGCGGEGRHCAIMAYGGEDVNLHLFLISALVLAYLPMEWDVWIGDGVAVVGKGESVFTHCTD